jgi:YHS domain-containing protein
MDQHTHNAQSSYHDELVKDAVCGMNVSPQSAKATSIFDKTAYVYCSENCKSKFDKEPQKYLEPPKHFFKLQMDVEYADVLPQQEAEIVRSTQSEGKFVAMAGNGINDAPALAQIQVGIAMGTTGTDVAMNTAGVTLVEGDLTGIVCARALSEGTIRNIGLLLGPIVAAAAMSLSSVFRVGNALRLKRIRL